MRLRSLHATPTLEFYFPDYSSKLELPFFDVGISAGFPSPADDFIELSIDLNKQLIKNKDTLNRVHNKLHDYGIKLVYQAKGEKTPVDGVSFWSNGNLAIGMTLRHNRLDNFAFTLFHELGHVYKHLVNNDTAEFIDLEHKTKRKNTKTRQKKNKPIILHKIV